MKSIYLLFLLVPLLLLGACKDMPRYEADSVITEARERSPDCNKVTIGAKSS